MNVFTDQAILLEVIDLQERDRIVDFLTAENGRHRGVAVAARSRRSRFAGQLQLLSTVHIRWIEKEGRELCRIAEAELVRPAAAIQEDLEGLLLSAYLAEQVRTFVQEGEPSATFFRLLDSTIAGLLAGIPLDAAARYFEVWVLRLSGLLPVPRECPSCGNGLTERAAVVEEDGSLVCLDCAAGRSFQPVDAATLAFLRRSGRENIASLCGEVAWPDSALAGIENLCRTIRRSFLNADLRSDRILRETMASLAPRRRD